MSEATLPAVILDKDLLRSVTTFTELSELFAASGAALVDVADFGDGFTLLDDKSRLLGTPFVITNGRLHDGDFGTFAILHVVTLSENGEITGRYIVNDGSTGIRDQWQEISAKIAPGAVVMCRHGLRKSDYMYTDSDGKERPATTFYLAI